MALVAGVVLLVLAGCNSSRTLDLSRGVTPPADIPGQDIAADADSVGDPIQTASLADPTPSDANANVLRPSRRSTPAAGDRGTISFKPVIGAPLAAVQPLSAQLGLEARENGLLIISASTESDGHVLVGYFSAFPEGDKTTVAFVWDVLDASNNRLHRLRGQEQVSGTAADPWTVVSPQVMETIASRTISDYLAWRAGSGT